MAGLDFVADVEGAAVFSCAIVLSIKASRSSAARLSASAFFQVSQPLQSAQ